MKWKIKGNLSIIINLNYDFLVFITVKIGNSPHNKWKHKSKYAKVTRLYLFCSIVKSRDSWQVYKKTNPRNAFRSDLCHVYVSLRALQEGYCWFTRNQQHREFHFFVTIFTLKILLYLVSNRICPVRSQRKPEKATYNFN